ncbi:MAG: hypothetical protein U9R05_10995 [Chloroflexota bacterium]|nr:hypothetical protein [Chloroflexota bacterium]
MPSDGEMSNEEISGGEISDDDVSDDSISNREISDEDLDELMLKQSQDKKRCKHRGYGDYERKHIYRGVDVKRDRITDMDEKKGEDQD